MEERDSLASGQPLWSSKGFMKYRNRKNIRTKCPYTLDLIELQNKPKVRKDAFGSNLEIWK